MVDLKKNIDSALGNKASDEQNDVQTQRRQPDVRRVVQPQPAAPATPHPAAQQPAPQPVKPVNTDAQAYAAEYGNQWRNIQAFFIDHVTLVLGANGQTDYITVEYLDDKRRWMPKARWAISRSNLDEIVRTYLDAKKETVR